MRIIDQTGYKLPPDVKKILLIQLGDIGDVVWTTPAIRAVQDSVPGAEISVLVREGFGDLLEADPAIKNVFETKQSGGNLLARTTGQLAFLRGVRACRFDLAIDLRLGDRGAFLSLLSGARYRVTKHHPEGVPYWRKYFFTHAVVPEPRHGTYGAAEQSLSFLRGLGIDTGQTSPRLWVTDAVKERVRKILIEDKIDPTARPVTINLFARWSYKEWGGQKWIDIINWLGQEFSVPVIIIGSAQERSKAEALIRQCHGQVFNLAGRTTLAELAGLLSLSRLHAGVDSAAPHIAAATGAPTVTIYGPTSWRDWAPVGRQHRVVVPDMDCVPCFKKGCDNSGRSLCLEALEAESVKTAIREALSEPSESLQIDSPQ